MLPATTHSIDPLTILSSLFFRSRVTCLFRLFSSIYKRDFSSDQNFITHLFSPLSCNFVIIDPVLAVVVAPIRRRRKEKERNKDWAKLKRLLTPFLAERTAMGHKFRIQVLSNGRPIVFRLSG